MNNSTAWFVPYINAADKTQLVNMLIHATQEFSDEHLNAIFAAEREQAETEN